MPYKDDAERRAYQVEYGRRRDPKTRSGTPHGSVVERNLIIIKNAKRGPCADCGGKFPPYVMSFHDDARVLVINSPRPAAPMYRVFWEIENAALVCANCMAERLHKQEEAGGQDGG